MWSGATKGGVRWLLRAEGACVLAVCLYVYPRFGGWGSFALGFLAPDLAMLGYLMGRRVGAVAYNAAHTYLGAIATLGLGMLLVSDPLIAAGLIWSAHIGFDRMLGYGLKYSSGFTATHLGRIGKQRVEPTERQGYEEVDPIAP